jgi:hypothetical protein
VSFVVVAFSFLPRIVSAGLNPFEGENLQPIDNNEYLHKRVSIPDPGLFADPVTTYISYAVIIRLGLKSPEATKNLEVFFETG